jgi:ethanolamine transporter EutH
MICVNASVTLCGALPFMFIVSKLLNKPLNKLGSKIGIDGTAAVCLLSTIVTNAPTIGLMEKMNKKGVVLNAAFAVSAGFTIGGHLALTMAYMPKYVVPMIVGKLVSGVFAILLAMLIYKEKHRIYWEIKKDPLIINDKEEQKEWFKSILDNSDPDYQQLQQKYINEVINLWNNRNY